MHARDHVTRARYFQIFMSQLLLTRTNFLFTFFSLFGKSFGNFIPRLFAALSFNLLALNLEFEPITQRELFLTWCRDPGCERSPSEQGFYSIFH